MSYVFMMRQRYLHRFLYCVFCLISGVIVCAVGSVPGFALDIKISRADADSVFARMQGLLLQRDRLLESRNEKIVSLKRYAHANPSSESMRAVGEAYDGVVMDSAIMYYERSVHDFPDYVGAAAMAELAVLFSKSGRYADAEEMFHRGGMRERTVEEAMAYYDAGGRMYRTMERFFRKVPEKAAHYSREAERCRRALLDAVDDDGRDNPLYRLALGEEYMAHGDYQKAGALLIDVFESESQGSSLRSRAAYLLSELMGKMSDRVASAYYLLKAVNNDLIAGDSGPEGLCRVGALMARGGAVHEAARYYEIAFDGALRSGNVVNILEAAAYMPAVIVSYHEKTADGRGGWWILAGVIAVLSMAVIAIAWRWRHAVRNGRKSNESLMRINQTRELYLNRFMGLCAVYVERLSRFAMFVDRKISSGKADEVSRMIKSGKFGNEQSGDFFTVFDAAFLNLYPDFLERVNELLQPDAAIELKEGEHMNTDLRILAFMRLGIDDTSRIAQMLNYSVNTIYAYRTRLRQRALDKDAFEVDVMNIRSS